MRSFLLAVVTAAVALLISQLLLKGSVLSLIPWGLGGIILGYLLRSQKASLGGGALYGFIISFLFMALGYRGAAPIVTRIPFFTILGLFGAFCGLVLSFIGFFFSRSRHTI